MTTDFRTPTMPGRSTSGLHLPDRTCLHQALAAVRFCRVACGIKGDLHTTEDSWLGKTFSGMDDSVEWIALGFWCEVWGGGVKRGYGWCRGLRRRLSRR